MKEEQAKEMRDIKTYCICMLIAIVFIVMFLGMIQLGVLQREDDPNMQYLARNGTVTNATGLNIPDIGFIVFTYGRNFEAINTTQYHEACHELVRNDYHHFCEEYYK